MSYVEEVIDRLKQSERTLTNYRDKILRLREIVAGSPYALIAKGSSQDQDQYDEKRAHATPWPDIFVSDIEEGRSNKLLHAIRTLGQQTTYQFPEIEAEDLEPEEANLHAEYVRQRLGPRPLGCDGVIHMRRALYDYLVGGFGWIWLGMQAGKPVIRYVDTIDCKWDQQSSTIADGTWWSTTMYGSLSQWSEMFPKSKPLFEKYAGERNARGDSPLELEYYYDLQGSQGHWLVLFKTGNEEFDTKPVFEAPNPCWWDYGGQRVPFLPRECMFFMELPSVRLPLSLSEQMLPHQIALWRIEKSIRDTTDNGGFREFEEESYDQKQLEDWRLGKTGGFLVRKKGTPPMDVQQPMEIPQTTIVWRDSNENAITAMGGASPFATGQPLQDPEFAANVNAVERATGLMAGTIAKENAAFWIRMLHKFLAKGAAEDEWPLVVRDEDLTLVFDESDPVKQYLRPDARLTIREESTQFIDRQTKIQLAILALDQALKVALQFPAAVKEAYENLLRAQGETNTAKYFEQPQLGPTGPQAMAPPGSPMAPPTPVTAGP